MKISFLYIAHVIILFLFCMVTNAAKDYRINDTSLISVRDGKINEKVWVFILAGQSNMAGRGMVESIDTITSPRVLSINERGEIVLAKEPLYFYEPKMKGVGCGLAFGKKLLEYIPQDVTILLIPTAVGGSSINQWLQNSTHRGVQLFTNFKEKVELGQKYGVVKAVLWHQGESDAKPEGIKYRQEKQSRLFADFRDVVGNHSLPTLIGELGSYSKDKKSWRQMNKQLRIYTAKDKNTLTVNTSDFKDIGDSLHFNSAGQRKMGNRFAKAYIRKFGKQ